MKARLGYSNTDFRLCEQRCRPALEFQHEGYVLGTAAQMFSIAGPVIVYGTAASAVFGFICYPAAKEKQGNPCFLRYPFLKRVLRTILYAFHTQNALGTVFALS